MGKRIYKSVISFAVILLIWQVATMICDFPKALFPEPVNVGKAFWELVTTGLAGSTSSETLLSHILVSLKRFGIGYGSSVTIAVIIGLFLGWFPSVYSYINPIVQLIRPIAPVAWMPFIVLWVGIGDTPAIVIIFIAGFFPVLLSTVSAVGTLDPVYLKVARNFELRKMDFLRKIVFPAIFPQIMTSLHLALSTSWIFLVSGEMVGAQSGLGFLIMDSKNCLRSDALLATMITIGLIGFGLDVVIKSLEKMVAKHWGVGATAVVQEVE